ncbi:ABC transporter permease [Peribacillus alkalitolerans]|uniref:ABC transporter permease n=1 Tax=Peribacillus alkalitolerans TaxID=1550385 RepID=UPI0013D1A802|nr:ABC transporter permease [Peribacillus alkalitolerans]
MRISALIIRILRQFKHDKRTIGLMIFAPILVLSLLSLVFNGDDYEPKIGFVNVPDQVLDKIDLSDADTETISKNQAEKLLGEQKLDAYLVFDNQKFTLHLEGSDPIVNGSVQKWLSTAFKGLQPQPATTIETKFLHGSSDIAQFDYLGPVLLGFFVFFFVFLIAGVSFLRERTGGTLERLMTSPLKLWEVVVGYVAGFGIFTIIQSAIIASYTIYVLDMLMEGSFFFVMLIILLLAFTALTLGILLSAFAQTELQMIQFIPIVIVPQVFFSGLFNLDTISSWVSWIGPLTPLYYGADALRDVMVRGYGFEEISQNLYILLGFCLAFMILNVLALRKYRKI